jgi:hypothetical protein
MPGPNLLLNAKAHHTGLPADKVKGVSGGKMINTLELVLRYIESPHTETIDCKFDKDKISVGMHFSNMPGNVFSRIERTGQGII